MQDIFMNITEKYNQPILSKEGKYLDSIMARLPDGPISVMGGTDRKWHQSDAEEAEIIPCEQPQYRFRRHFDTQTLYASDITPIP
jgi:hypothetical protein